MQSRIRILLAFLAGVAVCYVLSSVTWLLNSISGKDPHSDLVAVSWGDHSTSVSPGHYQVQVSAQGTAPSNRLEVSAKVCIGGLNHWHEIGVLGTATDMGDATKRFGTIDWQPDRVTIGGTEGIKATLMRNELERHR
jgi:hypothetical protein